MHASVRVRSHVDLRQVESLRARAYRLEPAGRRQSHMDVDGEVIDYGAVQISVAAAQLTIFCMPPKRQEHSRPMVR